MIATHEPFYFGIPMIVGNSFHGLMHKIGRYQVEHELGRGAMGIVYRAFDPAIGRRIAIKTIRLDDLGDEKSRATLRERLRREAQSAGILSHPNIVTIYDISEDTHNAYIFMEYVEGATMDQFSRGLPVKDLLSMLEQAAEALDYAHERGIVHRDVKPGILMLNGRQVKVTDFGIARLQHRDSTQSGTLLGTPSYMSPEQISGQEITGAADQYSLGVIAYEFLAGHRPFDNDNLANLLFRITQQPVPPVATLNAATNQVLARVLAKNPAHRYPNCTAFAMALEHALGLEPPKHTPQREISGDEPTVHEAIVEPVAEAVVPLPALNLPEPRKPSVWKPVAGMLFGVGLIVALLWISFVRSSVPEPVESSLVSNAGGEAKPSAMGEKVAEPVVPPVEAPTETKTAEAKMPELKIIPQPIEKTEKSEEAGGTFPIEFVSSPAGAEVLINNGEQDRCAHTPCTLDLPKGEFQVLIRLKGFDDSKRSLKVPGQSRIAADFEKPMGTVVVSSTPEGASVRIDGRDTGQKTPAKMNLSPGTYKLEVILNGLPVQTQEVTVKNGVVQTLAIRWN